MLKAHKHFLVQRVPLIREILYRIGYCLWSSFFRLFYDLRIEGAEHIPKRACLLVANHVSFYDPPLVGCAFREPIKYLARKTLFKPPILNWLLPLLGSMPIDQEKPDINAIRQTLESLRTGQHVLLFPEGARSLNGNVQAAQPGVGLILSKARVPVIPIRIFGAFEAWPPGGRIRLFIPMRVVIGAPIQFAHPIDREHYDALAQTIMKAIGKLQSC